MSNVVSALNGQKVVGATTVAEQGLRGMITLRGDLSAARLKKACKAVTGAEMPGKRGVSIKGESGIAWMSPDELLLLVPHSEADAIVAKIDAALKGTHFLAVNVSDARAMISVHGAGARAPPICAPNRWGLAKCAVPVWRRCPPQSGRRTAPISM